MLDQFMNPSYSILNYTLLNDSLLYTDYINRRYTYQQVAVAPIEAYRYQGNLYGLFKGLGISSSLYTYAMYLNGYTNPCNYDGVKTTFKVPIKVQIPEY